jgi:hypothetical protein
VTEIVGAVPADGSGSVAAAGELMSALQHDLATAS